MNLFLKFARKESRRLKAEHIAIVEKAYKSPNRRLAGEIELDSEKDRLWLAQEIDAATKIIQQSIKSAHILIEETRS